MFLRLLWSICMFLCFNVAMANSNNLLAEERFTKPKGFTFDTFQAKTGETIRYGSLDLATGEKTILILPGISEPIEKYYEVIRDLQKRGFAVLIMDWPSQGGSSRYLDNTNKRHTKGFTHEVTILHDFISAVLGGRAFNILAHSMGGHLALRYLTDYPHHDQKAVLSAPMLDLYIEPPLLKKAAPSIASFASAIGLSTVYAPGVKNWTSEDALKNSDKLTHDTQRSALQRNIFQQNNTLTIGGPTFGWLNETFKSSALLKDKYRKTDTKLLLFGAGEDEIVETAAIRDAGNILPNATYIEIDGAYHEIFMESNEYRDKAWKAFDEFIKLNNNTGKGLNND